MDPDYTAYLGKDEVSLRALLDVTPEFSERRKIRAAIRALKDDLSSQKTLLRPATIDGDQNGNHVPRRGSLIDGFSSPRERRESLRKEHGTLVSADGLQRELRLLEQARNPYDDIKDEQILTQLLKTSTELDDRVKIRAALRKLREENKNNETGLQEDSQISKPTTNGSIHLTPSEDSGQNDYSKIEDVHTLENMLSEVSDYEERKKIRAVIQRLRKQQLAAVAIKYSRNNSPDSVNSEEVPSESSNPPSEGPPPEPMKSRLVVTLNNPNSKVTQPEPKEKTESEKDFVPPLPTSPPPPNPRTSSSSDSEGDQSSETGSSSDLELRERQVQEKNLRNMEVGQGDGRESENGHGPNVPIRTSSLKATSRTFPWTSTKVNSKVNGQTVSDDCTDGSTPKSSTSSVSSASGTSSSTSSLDSSPTIDTAKEICLESDSNLDKVMATSSDLVEKDNDPSTDLEGQQDMSPLVHKEDVTVHSLDENSGKTLEQSVPDDIISKDTVDGNVIEANDDICSVDSKIEDSNPEVPKLEDPKQEDPKPADPKPDDPKPEEPKPEEPKPEEPKPEEPKPDAVPKQPASVVEAVGSGDNGNKTTVEPPAESPEKPMVTSIADAMEVLRGRLTYLEDELDSCDNFDERREIRATIREVRAQIKEETIKMSQKPAKSKRVLKKTTSAGEPGRPLALSRSFSSKEQGRNFLARKLKCQLGRSHSTKADVRLGDNEESTEKVDPNVPVFCAAPITRQYSRYDASTAPKDNSSGSLSRTSSMTSGGSLSRTGSLTTGHSTGVSTTDQPTAPRGRPGAETKRRFLTREGRNLNMSKASSGYGSVSGSDEEKDEDTAPKITQPLSNVTHNDGETVTLTCKVATGAKAKVIWYKDSKLLKKSSDFKQSFDGIIASLTITEIFPDDTGEYKIVVSNDYGQVESIAYMSVLETELPSAPSIETPLSDQMVQDGDNVVFECRVGGRPSPKVAWFKGERLLKDSPDFRQTLEGGRASLALEDVFPDDNGEYVCVATNKAGEARTSCNLLVKEEKQEDQEAPDITRTLENQEVVDGDQVTLTCGISGTPKPMITWYKDDKLLPNCTDFEQSYDGRTAKLVIDEVFEDDTGEYKVVAKNTAGEVSMAALLDVRANPDRPNHQPTGGPPTFTIPFSDVYSSIGHTAVLQGSLQADPRATVIWYKDGRLLRPTLACRQTYVGEVVSLEVREVTRLDVGSYECVARNDRGEERCKCALSLEEFTTTSATAKKNAFRKLGHLSTEEPRLQSLRAKLDEMKNRFGDDSSSNNGSRVQALQAKLDTKTDRWSSHQQHTSSSTNHTTKMPNVDIDSISDEDELHKLMTGTQDFDQRKKIRNRMKEVREKKAEEYKKKQESGGPKESAVQMRQRLADQEKQRKLKDMVDLDKKAKDNQSIGEHERYIREKHQKAEEDRQKKLEGYKEMGKVMSQVYHAGSDRMVTLDQQKAKELKDKHSGTSVTTTTKTETKDGGTVTTNVTTTRKTTKDGGTTTTTQTKQVTQSGGPGQTTYNVKKSSAETTAKQIANALKVKSLPGTCGVINVRAEAWNSREGTTDNSERTEVWGVSSGPAGARATFKDAEEKPGVTPGGGGKVGIQRSPSAIKEMLLTWCRLCTKEYENVEITNFSSAWNNGMAFCALIHHFRPVFDYKKLNPKCRRGNFKLAFDVAEKFADIAPLLDVDDMVKMKNPDWKCVFTYVQSFYRKFRDEEGAPRPKAAAES